MPTKYIISIIFTALVFGFTGFFFGQENGQKEFSTTNNNVEGYKYFFQQDLPRSWNFQIPDTWSMYSAGDVDFSDSNQLSRAPVFSVSRRTVSFGDMNFDQIDFYLALTDVTDALVREAKEQNPENWSKEQVGPFVADVYTYPLDNGLVTKGGSGGKDYYLTVPGVADGAQSLLIRKQAFGDVAFEAAFETLRSTFTTTNN